MIIILLLCIATLGAQIVPYETTSIKTLSAEDAKRVYISDLMFDESMDINLEEFSRILIDQNEIYIEALISTESIKTMRLELEYTGLPLGTKFFMLSSDAQQVIGPFYLEQENRIKLGPISESNFIIQCIIQGVK